MGETQESVRCILYWLSLFSRSEGGGSIRHLQLARRHRKTLLSIIEWMNLRPQP